MVFEGGNCVIVSQCSQGSAPLTIVVRKALGGILE